MIMNLCCSRRIVMEGINAKFPSGHASLLHAKQISFVPALLFSSSTLSPSPPSRSLSSHFLSSLISSSPSLLIFSSSTAFNCSQKKTPQPQRIAWFHELAAQNNNAKQVVEETNDTDETEQKPKKQNKKQKKRRLDVAIAGLPNAGKSQFLNAITESHIAAVSRKSHTTRHGILGCRTVNHETQILFVDTPGFLCMNEASKQGALQSLVDNARAEMECVDFTLLIIDAARVIGDDVKRAHIALMTHALQTTLGRMENSDNDHSQQKQEQQQQQQQQQQHPKFAIVLNKVDLVKPKSKLLDIAKEYADMADQCMNLYYYGHDESKNNNDIDENILLDESLMAPIFYISAKKIDGIDDILDYLVHISTPTQEEWIVPDGQTTPMEPMERVEEVIRESIYNFLHKEVPHHVKQVNQLFKLQTLNKNPENTTHKEGASTNSNSRENSDRLLVIHQDLIVPTRSHQKLVNGNGRKTLRNIQKRATKTIQKIFGCPTKLELRVVYKKSKNSPR